MAKCPNMSRLACQGRCLLLLAMLTWIGCSSRPAPISHPYIDVEQAVSAAMEQFDEDGDQLLDESELARCPGVRAALSDIDTDGDRKVSAAELEARIRRWQSDVTARVLPRVQVRMGQRPLAGAQIELVPEPFLADYLQPGVGKVSANGTATISIADVQPPGMACGLYQVKLTHPTMELPPEYNEQTRLGMEINADTSVSWDPIIFQVKKAPK